MKRRTLQMILIAACTLTFTVALAACRQKQTTREDLYEEGYICDVVIDLMGGTSGDGDYARSELHQYTQVGSPIVKPGNHLYSGEVPVKEGYTLGGYYRGTKAEDGTVTYGEKWDFSKDKVTEGLTLYAYWRENYKLVVHYGENFGLQSEIVIGQDEEGAADDVSTPSITGYTVIGYYFDRTAAENREEEKAVTFPFTPTTLSEASTTVEMWADALEGNFRLVRTARDFNVSPGTNVYLMADIDFDGEEISFPADYSGRFLGNGYTLSNFTVTRESQPRGDDYLGLFKRLTAKAYLENITFKDFTLNVSTLNATYSYVVGALAGRAQAGATLKNVTLIGTLNITSVKANEFSYNTFIGESEEGVIVEDCNYEGVVVTGYPEDYPEDGGAE